MKYRYTEEPIYMVYLRAYFAGFAGKVLRACRKLLEKVLVKYFCDRMNLTNICLNAYSKKPIFAAKHL